MTALDYAVQKFRASPVGAVAGGIFGVLRTLAGWIFAPFDKLFARLFPPAPALGEARPPGLLEELANRVAEPLEASFARLLAPVGRLFERVLGALGVAVVAVVSVLIVVSPWFILLWVVVKLVKWIWYF